MIRSLTDVLSASNKRALPLWQQTGRHCPTMPHNHNERKREVIDRHHTVIWGEEVSAVGAIAALGDMYVTGGVLGGAQYAREKAGGLGRLVADHIVAHGVSPNEPVYVGHITISHWESPHVFGTKLARVALPNSFIPYIAVGKK